MTIQVSTVQRATLTFDHTSTLLDLIQALSENLGGEWDDARLEIDTRSYANSGSWKLVAVMGSDEPNRPERWATEDGKHTAVWNATQGYRQCNCGVHGPDDVLEKHLNEMAGFNG